MSVETRAINRRNLFRCFSSPHKPEESRSPVISQKPALKERVLFSRREFGKVAIGTVAGLAMTAVTESSNVVQAQEATLPSTENPLVNSLRAKNESLDTGSLLSSFAQGAALGVSNSIVGRFLVKKGLPIENPVQKAGQKANTGINLVSGLIVSPIIQELAFREYPSLRFAPGENMRWDVGVASSALFTLYHNIYGSMNPPTVKIDTKRIHALAFPAALFLWWKVKQEGYYHAVVTHVGHNAGAFGYTLLQTARNSKPNK